MTNTTATPTTITAHIARDSYEGRWQITRPDSSTLGRRTAGYLADQIGDGNTGIFWEFSGHTRAGRLLYTRTRFVAREGKLVGFDSDGVAKVIHPADRVIGFLAAP